MPTSGVTVVKTVTLFFFAYSSPWNAASAPVEPQGDMPSTLQCPIVFISKPQPAVNPAALNRELIELTVLAEICDMRPDFHAYRGTLLLSIGLVQEAVIALEKALLLDPNLAGAQIDYAQALGRVGQRQPAQDLINQVTQRPDITPQLKQWLQDGIRSSRPGLLSAVPKKMHQEEVESLQKDKWLWAGRIQATVGREANLNGVSHTTVLPLYLDSGIVEVDLVDSEQPRAGSALKMLALVNGVTAVGDGHIRWTSAIQGKHPPNYSAYRSQSFESRITYGQSLMAGTLSGTLGWSTFQQSAGQRYKNYSYRLEYQPNWHILNCSGLTHLGRAVQTHKTDTLNNGTDDHFGVEFGCGSRSHDLSTTVGETVIGLSAGRYSPQSSERLGGNKNRVQLQIQHHIPLSWSSRHGVSTVAFFGRWSNVRDQKIISVLFGPEPTQIHRTEIGISYWHPLGQAWSVGVELDYSSQRSSNKLNEVKNRSIFSGVRWIFG